MIHPHKVILKVDIYSKLQLWFKILFPELDIVRKCLEVVIPFNMGLF